MEKDWRVEWVKVLTLAGISIYLGYIVGYESGSLAELKEQLARETAAYERAYGHLDASR